MFSMWFVVCYLLIFPALEEYVFREGLLAAIDDRYPQLAGFKANVLVSLLFGALHAIWWTTTHAALVFLVSLLLGYLWQRYKRLALCVFAHGVFNTIGYFTNLEAWLLA
jgi:membrane protease YdiL (CAAX protease family)